MKTSWSLRHTFVARPYVTLGRTLPVTPSSLSPELPGPGGNEFRPLLSCRLPCMCTLCAPPFLLSERLLSSLASWAALRKSLIQGPGR